MIYGHAFGSLGEILAVGGDVYLARKISAGALAGYVVGRATAMFETPTPSAVKSLVDLARAEATAGVKFTGLLHGDSVGEVFIPTNRRLFETLGTGSRYRWGVDIVAPDSGDKLFQAIESTEVLSPTEMFEHILGVAEAIESKYPADFQLLARTKLRPEDIFITYAVAAF
jgi:hypothetical protein